MPSMLRVAIDYYPDEDAPEHLRYALLLILLEPDLATDTCRIACEVRPRHLIPTAQVALEGFSANPDKFAVILAALACFTFGATGEEKSLHMEMRDKQKPNERGPSAPRVIRRSPKKALSK